MLKGNAKAGLLAGGLEWWDLDWSNYPKFTEFRPVNYFNLSRYINKSIHIYNVGKAIINHPIVDGLCNPFMVILGMVDYCFNHIIYCLYIAYILGNLVFLGRMAAAIESAERQCQCETKQLGGLGCWWLMHCLMGITINICYYSNNFGQPLTSIWIHALILISIHFDKPIWIDLYIYI